MRFHRIAPAVAALALATLAPLAARAGVYVSNVDDETISVIDPATNTEITVIPVTSEPRNLAPNPDGTRVYVPNRFSDSVSVIDTAINVVIAEVTDPSFFEPYALAVTPDGGEVWVANKQGGGSETGSVTIIDAGTNTVVASIDDPCFVSPEGIAINPVSARAYVVNKNGNSVCIVDTGTRSVVTSVAVGSAPRYAVVTPDGATVYISGSPVMRITTATNAVTSVSGAPNGRNMAITAAGDKVYVATQGSDIKVIATATNTVTALPFPGASSTYGVAVVDQTSRGYVTDENNNEVLVFDTSTDTVVTGTGIPIPVGSTPRAIAATPGPPGKALVLPARVTFFRPTIGSTPTETISIQNIGQGILTGSVGTLSGSFSVLSGGGAFSLAPGATRTVTVQFTASARGTARGALVITSDDPTRPSVRVPVSGIVR